MAKVPALAISFGMAPKKKDDGMSPNAYEEEEAEGNEEGGADEAVRSAGDAALEAIKNDDGVALMKALIAGVKAGLESDDEAE